MQTPEPLSPGDSIAIVAPSGPVPPPAFWSGVSWLRDRYRVKFTGAVLSRSGFLAGDDERRARELSRAFEDPEVRAVVAARGGYGATRIAHMLPWEELVRRPKWLVGFSDVTALHSFAWNAGVRSVHGANVTGLGAGADPRTRASWLRCLEFPQSEALFSGLTVLRAGAAHGPMVGGNVTVIAAMAAAGSLQLPRGAIVLLEDVGEYPYRIDRAMTSLLHAGILSRASAFVLGGFDRCTPGPDGVSAMDVMRERLAGLGVPVLANASFGHGERNLAFIQGADAEVRGDALHFRG